MRSLSAVVAAIAAVALAATNPGPELAHAQAREPLTGAPRFAADADSSGAPPDSMGGYLRSLADSTDRYFGESAAPVDTAGLDSSLAVGLTKPPPRERRRLMPRVGPWASFDRVDGALWGGSLAFGEPEGGAGRLSGRIGYAAGPNDWRGGGRYQKRWSGRRDPRGRRRSRRLTEEEPRWTLDASGGSLEALLDPEHRPSFFGLARALLRGSDREHYFLREGFRLSVERETGVWRAGLSFRDDVESPLVTTTTWNLMRRDPAIVFNLPAAAGRASEVRADLSVRLARLGLRSEGSVAVAADALGSDFEYTRMRVAVGGERPFGTIASLVPQLEYGRLEGDAIPQASFFLGGSHSLRSLDASSLGGTVKALGRLELYFPRDLLALAHLPHPAAFPIHSSLFTASGAVSGTDPFGGGFVNGDSWPAREAWRSEAGFAFLWRAGIPDPLGALRLDFAWQVGPGSARRISIEYSRPLDLFRPFGE